MNNNPKEEFKERQYYMLKKILQIRFKHYSKEQEEDIISVCKETNIIDAFARMDYYTEINRKKALEEQKNNPQTFI